MLTLFLIWIVLCAHTDNSFGLESVKIKSQTNVIEEKNIDFYPVEFNTNPCYEINLECPPVDGKHPVYAPLPDCTQFCQCSNGVPYLHNCSEGLHFNPTLNVCDYPYNAGCLGSTGDQECHDTGLVCPAKDGDFLIYGPLPNCSQFCVCSNGSPFVRNCPDDLHFNPNINQCDVPEHAGCMNVTEPDQGDQICIASGIECPSKDNDTSPVYGPLPDCSQFCLCSGGFPYLHNCSEGLHFSPTLNICVAPEHAGCSNNTDDFAGDQICLDSGLECPAVDGLRSVYGPVDNCSQFCLCKEGKPYLFDCPNGLHFNRLYDTCDWPHNVGCASGNKACYEANMVCPPQDEEYPVFAALPNCTEFCLCSKGNPHRFDCPEGLHFDPILNVCHWPENAKCGATNEPEVIESDPLCVNENLECPIQVGGRPTYHAMPKCTQFCECSNGTLFLRNCTGNLQFNPILNTCVWPDHSQCVEREAKKPCPVELDCPNDGSSLYLPLTADCSQYCQCNGKRANLQQCANGLHFSPGINRCVWRDFSDCTAAQIYNAVGEIVGKSVQVAEQIFGVAEQSSGVAEQSFGVGEQSSGVAITVSMMLVISLSVILNVFKWM